MDDFHRVDKTIVRSSGMEKHGISPGKVGQEQIHGLLFSDRLSWQAIIYDLINTEQLNPWDINICLLANKYLEKIRELEEANFLISSKVLLAASLLLRIKSEILLNNYLPGLDEILFGKNEEKKYVQERIELEDEIPDLIPRTPLPRSRKVTLQELMVALGKAIKTENRRIKRVVIEKQRDSEMAIVLPRGIVDLQFKIKTLYSKLKIIFSNKECEKIPFSSFSGKTTDEMISNFMSLLYLDSQNKIFAEQEKPFDEIWVWLKHIYEEKHADVLEIMKKEAREAMREDLIQIAREGELEELQKKMRKRKFKKFGKKVEAD